MLWSRSFAGAGLHEPTAGLSKATAFRGPIETTGEEMISMKKVLTILFFAAFAIVTTTPMLTKMLGFGSAAAYAGQGENDDDQGDNDNQGEDGQ
jgi:hypothetical protein